MDQEILAQYIGILEKQQAAISNQDFDLKVWSSSVNNILTRIYGAGSPQAQQLNKLFGREGEYGNTGGSYSSWNDLSNTKKQATKLLKAFIEELRDFGVPDTSAAARTLGLALAALEDELTGKQLKEIKALALEDIPAELKQKQMAEKLRSFGEEVSANVLATMLTHPDIIALLNR